MIRFRLLPLDRPHVVPQLAVFYLAAISIVVLLTGALGLPPVGPWAFVSPFLGLAAGTLIGKAIVAVLERRERRREARSTRLALVDCPCGFEGEAKVYYARKAARGLWVCPRCASPHSVSP